MNQARLAHFQSLLEEQLASLDKSNVEHQKMLDENRQTRDFVGPDRASELGTLEVDASVAESEINLAGKIHHALERIAAGTYGICEGCGIAIPEARLEAKPSVALCVSCQELHEAGAL